MWDRYEELKEWKRLAKIRRKPSPSKPPRKASAGGSVGVIARHYKEEERDDISKYDLGKLRRWKRKTPKSKYKPRKKTRTSRYKR